MKSNRTVGNWEGAVTFTVFFHTYFYFFLIWKCSWGAGTLRLENSRGLRGKKLCLCLDLNPVQTSNSQGHQPLVAVRWPLVASPPTRGPTPILWKHPHLLFFSLPSGASVRPPAKLHEPRAPSTSHTSLLVTKPSSCLTGSR